MAPGTILDVSYAPPLTSRDPAKKHDTKSETNIFPGPSNCTDLVANYPEAFTDAYWEINSFQVYQAA
jgi:hypothetical protein